MMRGKDTFLYFAFGSNMLTQRIHVQNQSAKAVGTAMLKDHELDFRLPSKRWHGCAATVIPCPGKRVWGVLWELKNEDLKSLDDQEGVPLNIYRRLTVKVHSKDGSEELHPYTYRVCDEMMIPKTDDCRPSKVYKNIMIEGAKENGLPNEYVQELMGIKDNGYDGPVEVKLALNFKMEPNEISSS